MFALRHIGVTRALQETFTNWESVLPDVVVMIEVTQIIHQPAGDGPRPWCETPGDEYQHIRAADATKFGGSLCSTCFGSALRELADDPERDIGRVDDRPDATPEPGSVPRVTPDGGTEPARMEPIASLTEQVAVPRGSGSCYHAPRESGKTVCGLVVNQVIDRGRAPRSLRPCSNCFVLEE